MTKTDRNTLIAATVVCLLPLALGAAVYAELPAQIPYHWGINGQPDNWMPKEYYWIVPVGMAVMNVIVQLILIYAPLRNNIPRVFTRVLVWMIPVMTIILYPVTIFYSLGVNIPISLVVLLMVGMIILIIGNYMPKTRWNYTVGIKVPWTLKNEEVWNKTHRLAGWLWTAGGLVFIIAALTMQSVPVFMFALILTVIALITVIPIIYSAVLYTKQEHTEV